MHLRIIDFNLQPVMDTCILTAHQSAKKEMQVFLLEVKVVKVIKKLSTKCNQDILTVEFT